MEKNLKLQCSYSTGCWAARNAVFQRGKKKSFKSRQLSEPCGFGEGVRGASLRENMKWKIKKRNCVVWEDNVSGGGSDRKMFTCLFSKQKTPHGNISG